MPDTRRLEQVLNFRDIGGHVTADGSRVRTSQVYRSGHLADATNRDLQLLTQLRIRTVIDMRDAEDIAIHGEDRLPQNAQLVRVPYPGERSLAEIYDLLAAGDSAAIASAFPPGTARQLCLASSAEAAGEAHWRAQFADVMRAVLGADGAAIIHCAAGKDRTGFAVAVIHASIGVLPEGIIADYMRSNDERSGHTQQTLGGLAARGVDTDLVEPFYVQREEYIRVFLKTIEDDWGGTHTYLREGLALSENQIEALRHRLLER